MLTIVHVFSPTILSRLKTNGVSANFHKFIISCIIIDPSKSLKKHRTLSVKTAGRELWLRPYSKINYKIKTTYISYFLVNEFVRWVQFSGCLLQIPKFSQSCQASKRLLSSKQKTANTLFSENCLPVPDHY